jgi:hypothetical protein
LARSVRPPTGSNQQKCGWLGPFLHWKVASYFPVQKG